MRELVDLSYALTWMIGTSAVFGLVTSLQQLRHGIRGWFYVNLVLLLIVGIGASMAWEGTGFLAFFLWLGFVVVPEVANRRARVADEQQQLALAARWSKVAGALHPFDGQLERARLLASEYQLDLGNLDAAKGELYPLLNRPAWAERAKVELLRLDERWSSILAHAQAHAVGKRDLQLASVYLRALGELGDLESMWTMYGQIPSPVARQPGFRLQMASYTGMVELAESLLSRHFSRMSTRHANAIRATALYAAGRRTDAERLLLPIAQGDTAAARRASLRLARPIPRANPERLSTHASSAMAHFEHSVRVDLENVPLLGAPRSTWCTTALIAVLVLVYLVGVPGGTTDPENLVKLGALVLPIELTSGDTTWRLFAAGFLHLGFTHLLMNCLGLWVLGRQVEQLWNGFVLLTIFLTASVGSFAFAWISVHATAAEPRIFLGASSGVLGLVGAIGTFFAIGYSFYRRKALRGRLMLVVAVVLAQLLFDWFTPIVSSMLHLSGLAIGAFIAIPFSIRTWHARRAPWRTLPPV